MAAKKSTKAAGEARPSKKKAGSQQSKVSKAEDAGTIQVFIKYLKEVRAEFDKITWANKKETIGLTVAVLAITFFFAAYLGIVDFGLTQLLSLLY